MHIAGFGFIRLRKVFDGKIEIFQDVCEHDFSGITSLVQFFGVHLQLGFIPGHIAKAFHFVHILPGTEEADHGYRTVNLAFIPFHLFVTSHKIVAGTDVSPVSISPSATGSRNRFKIEDPGLRFLVHVTVRFIIGTGSLRPR